MTAIAVTLSDHIGWLKAFHIIAVIAWMSGLLYLPRLFVYHTQTVPGSPESDRFKVMERKLLRIITTPAMIAVWIFGPLLAWLTGAYLNGWLQMKFLLVLALSGVHGFLARCVKNFADDANNRSEHFYRIINEVPTLLMIAIVILTAVKPF
jgi:putative membrane protein